MGSPQNHKSVEEMIFLTVIKTPPQREVTFLKDVKSALKTSALLIAILSHDSVPVTTLGLYLATKLHSSIFNLQHN